MGRFASNNFIACLWGVLCVGSCKDRVRVLQLNLGSDYVTMKGFVQVVLTISYFGYFWSARC